MVSSTTNSERRPWFRLSNKELQILRMITRCNEQAFLHRALLTWYRVNGCAYCILYELQLLVAAGYLISGHQSRRRDCGKAKRRRIALRQKDAASSNIALRVRWLNAPKGARCPTSHWRETGQTPYASINSPPRVHLPMQLRRASHQWLSVSRRAEASGQ